MKSQYLKRVLYPKLPLIAAVLIILLNVNVVDARRTVRKVSSHKIGGTNLQPDKGYGYYQYTTGMERSHMSHYPSPQIKNSSCSSDSTSQGVKCKKHKTAIKSFSSYTTKTTSLKKSSVTASPTEIVPSLVVSSKRKDFFNVAQNSSIEIPNLKKLSQFMKTRKKKCRHVNYSGFQCQKLKLYVWLVNEFDKNTTKLNSWLELVRNEDVNRDDIARDSSALMPENWPENVIYKLLRKWGDPSDQFLFHKYKQFSKSRELKLNVPHILELKLSPITHAVAETGRSTPRIFWDPGFNLKLKLPFFRDELKVAISTGPSFLAGIGTGIVLLIIKSLFAPFLFGLKWMLYNIFFKDGNPWDMMKMLGWGHTPEPWESSIPPPVIEQYEPPHVHNHFDNMKEHFEGGGGGGGGNTGYGFGYNNNNNYDQKLQFSQLNPILQGLTGASNMYKASIEEGRNQQYKPLLTAPPDEQSGGGGFGITGGGSVISESQDNKNVHDSGYNYIPSTALQAEVENYDPFYSPLLSKIDSIFTHLGYHDEGCRERAVCSIYKFPVKYAPYSNLLSAQLSKHQSELKRPVTSSAKVLRYFKYMKAAKDGQGAANCIDLYPKCSSNTDSVSNLPMVTTLHQLSELMGAEGASAG